MMLLKNTKKKITLNKIHLSFPPLLFSWERIHKATLGVYIMIRNIRRIAAKNKDMKELGMSLRTRMGIIIEKIKCNLH